MKQRATLYTPRLILRPFEMADARDVQRLVGDQAVADTTLNIPHPYEDGMAEEWKPPINRSSKPEKGVLSL